ncbi:MAG TPA: ABC transporter ATP-binding protein [bacterium]|nr:ABC transporter ATP-binding protein [bacterium]
MSALLEVENLSYRYGDRQALKGLSFSVARGEIFGFLGPNGGGKTTTFKILSTLFSTEPGQVRLFGLDLSRDRLRIREKMGVVFQWPALDKKLKVEENLWHQGHLYGLHGRELESRIRRDLSRLGLLDRAKDKVGSLSGGLQRRVELAKALLNNPELLVLDEPSTGLDPSARKEFWAHLETLRREAGMTVLVTTHFLEEADRCDRLLILSRGEKVALGSPEQLKSGLGAEVMRLRVKDPEGLAPLIEKKLGVALVRVEDLLCLESKEAHRLVAPLMEAFEGQVLSLTLGLPTLEDVFIHHTGRRFEEGGSR